MRKVFISMLLISPLIYMFSLTAGHAATKGEIDREVNAALGNLSEKSPQAKELAQSAKGVLVFPRVVKAGFIIGAQRGEGALVQNGVPVAYYNTSAVSYGLQAGVQSFGYALFFMTDEDMAYLDNSGGWELGSGPTLVVGDSGVSGALTSTTLKEGVYAFFFSQRGLMAGLGLQGTKISKIKR